MKCLVKNCQNHSHEGKFIGDLCSPCFQFLTTEEGKFSQVYRNTVLKEREACAKLAETASDYLQNSTFQGVANAIRARGQKEYRGARLVLTKDGVIQDGWMGDK